jgi:hypothetical protein
MLSELFSVRKLDGSNTVVGEESLGHKLLRTGIDRLVVVHSPVESTHEVNGMVGVFDTNQTFGKISVPASIRRNMSVREDLPGKKTNRE